MKRTEVKIEEGSGPEKKWIWGKCQDGSAIKLPCHHRNKREVFKVENPSE